MELGNVYFSYFVFIRFIDIFVKENYEVYRIFLILFGLLRMFFFLF